MIMLLMLVAYVMIVIVKALQVTKDLREHCYSWRGASFATIAFVGTVAPSLQSACAVWGCAYSLRLGWLANLLHQVPPFTLLSLDKVQILSFYLVGFIGIYFFGHVLGWVIHGLQLFWRRVA